MTPFPYGDAPRFLHPDLFLELQRNFPSAESFDHRADLGDKMLLNEHRNGEAMRRFLDASPGWRAFYEQTKSAAAAAHLLHLLEAAGVDLGVSHLPIASPSLLSADVPSPDDASETGPPRLELRLEFFRQAMPAGSHLPHTDRPGKLATFLVGFNDHDWPTPEVGALSICRARDSRFAFNLVNRYLDFQDVETIDRLPHRSNTANVLVKTHNSLHAVVASPPHCAPLPDRLTLVLQLYLFPMPIRQRRR